MDIMKNIAALIGFLEENYGITKASITKAALGVGSDTYFVADGKNKYVLKLLDENEMNNAEAEIAVCERLIKQAIPACRFIAGKDGAFIYRYEGRSCHLQRFFEGVGYELNSAPDWLMPQMSALLGDIHTALGGYDHLSPGIGADFFAHMTPQRALLSYEQSLFMAKELSDFVSTNELAYRIGLMKRFPKMTFDLSKLTLVPTHGDYGINQLICDEKKRLISAVIDWSSACVHPAVWEITRSYAYASPRCAAGAIDTQDFIVYVRGYMEHHQLNQTDIENLGKLFYYQISVCDYYNQYYRSTSANREIFLHQARFSTALMRWFEANPDFDAAVAAALLPYTAKEN